MLALPFANVWLNLRRPYPPIRGWVMQQLVKLHAAAELGSDVVLMVDSDVVFVRPVTGETFRKDGRLCYYRRERAVDESMPRHMIWHDVSRRLLGLPPAGPPPLPDYVSPLNAWDRQVVLGLRDRIEQVTGRPWLDAIGSQLHLSEFILYGVFVEGVLGTSADVLATDSMLLHTYWDTTPMARGAAEDFVCALSPQEVAVMISAKSGTPLEVRRQALSSVPSTASPGGDHAQFQRGQLRPSLRGVGVRHSLAGGAAVLPALPHEVLGDAAPVRAAGPGAPRRRARHRRWPDGLPCRVLWNDRGCLADIDDSCFAGLRAHGIDAFQWNLALEDPPEGRRFDAIFFSEVIEHLPVPGHIALGRLRKLLRPGGLLLCSTPNLYRLRNAFYLLTGHPLFDHFDLPGTGGVGHVLEYSAEHLAWQLQRAGFVDYAVDLEDFTHVPNARLDRLLSAVGAPLRRIPRYRDNLLAVATAP